MLYIVYTTSTCHWTVGIGELHPLTPLIEPHRLKMKLYEMGEKLFDVVPVLAGVSCMTYFMCSAAHAFVDQENHLVPV